MAEFDRTVFFNTLFSKDENNTLDYLRSLNTKVPAAYSDQLFSNTIQNNQWTILAYLLDNGYIETDLFEYESFNQSLVARLIKPSLFKEEEWTGYLPLFDSYLTSVEDINEEVGGYNLLSYAIEEKASANIIKAIIAAGINMGYKSRYGLSYLYQYCQQLRMPSAEAAEVVQLLLDSGVDINAPTVEQKTALFAAIEANHLPVVQILLEEGADIQQRSTKGLTPFFIAAVHLQNVALVKLLLQYGTPDFTELTAEGENLLNAYLRYIQKGSSSLEILSLLLENGGKLTDTSQYYSQPKSAVDWLAEKPSEILSFVLENNYLDVDEQDNNGDTILIKVCSIDSNHEESVAKDTYRKVKMLLGKGADSAIQNTQDKKAVDYAMQDQLKTKVVEILLGR